MKNPPWRSLTIDRLWDGRPAASGEEVRWQVAAVGDGEREDLWLRVEAPFHDDPPPTEPPGPTPRLWQHEVVELFVAGPGAADDVEYLEVELGPHGHHLVLRLHGVRRVVESELSLEFRARIDRAPITGARWTGEAHLPAAWLPPRPWRLNAYTIHGVGRQRRHLAMQPVPGAAPDFHRPECFVAWQGLQG